MRTMILATFFAISCAGGLLQADDGVPTDVNRSPIAVAVSPDGRYCVSANHTAGSVSLVDLETGRVVTERRCGNGPCDVAWTDEQTILVTLQDDDAVGLLTRQDERLTTKATIPVGDEPRGIALGPNHRAFIAVSGADEVAVLNWKTHKVVHRIAVGGMPSGVAVSPNGQWLVTLCNVPGEVFVHAISFPGSAWKRNVSEAPPRRPDRGEAEPHEQSVPSQSLGTRDDSLLSRRPVFDDGFNLGPPIITADSNTVIFAGEINRTFPVSEDNIEKGWAIDNRLTKLPLPDGKYWEQKQMGLDVRGDAAGDPWGIALSPDEQWLVVTCGGSHELLIFQNKSVPWPPADPGDFIPPDLLLNDGRFRRVELGGRPLDVEFTDAKRAVVANYLLNALQIVDVAAGELVRTIALGGPEEPSLARRGEMIFYDADRSFNRWFSCHTCHTDGHTSGQTFDTLNDGNYDTHKLTPSLRGVTHTPPWTWHGWQTDLGAAMRKSLTSTLNTQKPITDDDVRAMLAFLQTLEPPVSPHRQPDGSLTPAANRGKILFQGKGGCVTCHRGPYFTSNATFKVGLESRRYFYPEFNPPSLRGLHARRRFLHDGRADSLEEVLTRHHRPEDLAGEKLTDGELHDLIAYLKSL